MRFSGKPWALVSVVSLLVNLLTVSAPQAQAQIVISYGGHNETAGPMWVAADKGLFRKYGLDVSVLQVRSGQLNITTLMSGEVQATWPAISSVLSGVSGGAKIGCVASPFNRIARELVVRRE